jgi:hypothetical protein
VVDPANLSVGIYITVVQCMEILYVEPHFKSVTFFTLLETLISLHRHSERNVLKMIPRFSKLANSCGRGNTYFGQRF